VGRRSVGNGLRAATTGGHDHHSARAGEEGKGGGCLGRDQHARGPAQRNSRFFDLIKVVSNQIDLIEIKDGLPEI
jgi:hypothetical protein